ncbi:hypothetical protein SDC9_199300 [bioreactor metagenome]|uniref:Uncharacterized protein n=1 Tax=bioreactor metagenome TaxID=1076179 RepID=A0A645IK32_9ZZZZ
MADQLADHDAQRHRSHQRHHRRRIAKAADDQPVQRHPQATYRNHSQQAGRPQQHPWGGAAQRHHQGLQHRERHEGRNHGNVAMGEMNHLQHTEQQAEAQGEQAVDAAQGQPVNELLEQHIVHVSISSTSWVRGHSG